MKCFYALLLAFLLIVSCGLPEGEYKITVSGQGLNNRKAVLYRYDDSVLITVDSAYFERNSLVLGGSVSHPELMYLFVGDAPDYLPIFVENSDIKVSYNFAKPEKSVVTGSESHKNFVDFIQSYSAYCDKGAGVNRMYAEASKNSDSLIINNLDSIIGVLNNEKNQFQLNFVQNNITSPIAPYILATQLMYNLNNETFEKILGMFPKSNRDNRYYKKAETYFNALNQHLEY